MICLFVARRRAFFSWLGSDGLSGGFWEVLNAPSDVLQQGRWLWFQITSLFSDQTLSGSGLKMWSITMPLRFCWRHTCFSASTSLRRGLFPLIYSQHWRWLAVCYLFPFVIHDSCDSPRHPFVTVLMWSVMFVPDSYQINSDGTSRRMTSQIFSMHQVFASSLLQKTL